MRHGYIMLTQNQNKQTKQWKHAGSRLSKKFKGVPSVGIVIDSVSWDCPIFASVKSLDAAESCVLVFCCSRTIIMFTQHKWQWQRKMRLWTVAPCTLHQTSTFSPNSNPTCGAAVLSVTMTSYVLLLAILDLNIGDLGALTFRGTVNCVVKII